MQFAFSQVADRVWQFAPATENAGNRGSDGRGGLTGGARGPAGGRCDH